MKPISNGTLLRVVQGRAKLLIEPLLADREIATVQAWLTR